MNHWVKKTVAAGIGLALLGGAMSGTAQAEPKKDTVDLCALPNQTGEYQSGYNVAAITVSGTSAGPDCLRSYDLDSGLLDGDVDLSFTERADRPQLRTGSAVLDGIYAMALHEEKLLSVNSVSNSDYNGGSPMNCSADGVGCYITGKNWTYVWTRDLAYAVDLGFAAIDPVRARNSLAFKLSDRRDGSGDTQIMQDTGTGGSYPNSSDRVTWAVGASEVLNWLGGDERVAFAEKSLDAIRNTIEHDRHVVYNQGTGLYMGETSFLDWRQQTYPDWTAKDVTQITTSQSLSTNIDHWIAIDTAAKLSKAAGKTEDAAKYRAWADALAGKIREAFWLKDRGQFSAVLSNALNQSPAERYDALATALVVLSGIADKDQAAEAIQNYPQTPYGPSVIWPQQQEDERSYHNKGVWPFVTAYMMRAAAKVGNDQATTEHMDAIIRSAALYASNYENLNITTGDIDTALNSKYQAWSVAGALGMVQDTMFGIEATDQGLSVKPFLTAQVRSQYFPTSKQISLSKVNYQGKKLDVVLDLPESDAKQGAYAVTGITVDGKAHEVGAPIAADELSSRSVVRVQLGDALPTVQGPKVLNTYTGAGDDGFAPYAGDEAVFGPKIPAMTGEPTPNADRTELSLNIDLKGEKPASMSIIRDGVVVADKIEPAATWTDKDAGFQSRLSYCYSVRTTYASGNTSQDADPVCYWGDKFDRITKIEAKDFKATGGKPSISNGVLTHYMDWGTAPGDTISVDFTPTVSGTYLIQTDYALGYDIRSGVTSGIKRVSVTDGDKEVGNGILVMPNTDSWSEQRGSTFVPVTLKKGITYKVTLKNDRYTANMSYFKANAAYNFTAQTEKNLTDVFRIKAMLKRASVEDLTVAVDSTSDTEAEVGQSVALAATVGSGQPLSLEDLDGALSVDWGDGSGPEPLTATEAKGVFTTTAQHTYAKAGTYEVTVTAAGATKDTTVKHTVVVRDQVALTTDPAAPDGSDGWFVHATTATLSLGGNAEGAALQYRLDESADWQAYAAPLKLGEGIHKLGYRSVGKAGREGVAKSADLKVDTVAPEATGTAKTGETDATVTLQATDATSGLARIEYRLADADQWTPYTEAFKVPRAEQPRSVQYRAADVAGNVSQVKTLPIEQLPAGPTGTFEVAKVLVDKAGLAKPDAVYTIDYFVNGSEGPSGSVQVKAGEKAKLEPGLAVGTTVTFKERTPDPVATGTWQEAVIDPGSIVIAKDSTPTVTVTNTLTQKLGTFSIAKQVVGAEADDTEFTFTYTVNGVEASVKVSPAKAWTSEPLPQGSVVTVKEAGTVEIGDLRFDGVSWSGTGVKEADGAATFTVGDDATVMTATNTYADKFAPKPSPSATPTPGGDGKPKPGLPSTGAMGAMGLALLAAIGGAGGLLVTRMRRRA